MVWEPRARSSHIFRSSRGRTGTCFWWPVRPPTKRALPLRSVLKSMRWIPELSFTESGRCTISCTIRLRASVFRPRCWGHSRLSPCFWPLSASTVLSYLVSQSTHDIGILVALGASPGNIIGLVVGQGMQLTLIGILTGLAGAAVLTRVIAGLLFGVGAMDAATFLTVPALLAAVAFAATAIPAWRATRVDPMVALREE